MDIETLKELLNEYLVPVGTINWMKFLVDALPFAVTIITVITTSIVQTRNSKRETERLLAQLEQQKELERVRHEEARKNTAHEFNLKANEKLHTERLEAYSSLVDTLYNAQLMGDIKSSVYSAYIKSVKLLSLCTPDDELFRAVHFVVELFEHHINSGDDISDQTVQSLKSSTQSIAIYLNCPSYGRSEASDSKLPA